jgi:hypothetical protein
MSAPLVLGCLIWAAALTGGCAAPARVAAPLTAGPIAGNDPHNKTEFWYQLGRRPAVSNDEAFHALLLYFNGDDPAKDYIGRVAILKQRKMLSAGFDRPADEMAERGVVALAIARAADIKGGLTMQLLGGGERYADRALQYRGLLPPGSPNQFLSGGQFVAVIGRLEDYQRGNPNEAPAAMLPAEIGHPELINAAPPDAETKPAAADEVIQPYMLNVVSLSANAWWQDTQPAAGAATKPVATKDHPAKLKVIITGVEGDAAEIRKSPADPWIKARVGQSLNEGGEFRTGPKSAIRFVIPPDQVFTLDRQGTCSVLQAVYDGKKVTADVGMQQGRVRLDVAPIIKPLPKADPNEPRYEFDQGGIQHGISIRSPNAALAVRGTLVSLYDEPGFTPEAVSLTGQATFQNTRRQLVAFGGTGGRATIRGDQGSAAQQAFSAATALPNSEVARNDFDAQQTALLLDRGGTQRGDVLTGNSRITDAALVPTLPGALNFVLRWDGGPERKLNDLNLVVFSPLHTSSAPDFVGNPPFTLSLTPGDPTAEKTRAQFYPRSSRSGGQISKNHVGPEGLEFASWPKNYPAGNYRVVVFNLLDAVPAPTTSINPVNYTIDVFLNKRVLINTVSGSVGELQTSTPVVVPVPATSGGAAVPRKPSKQGRTTAYSSPRRASR